MKNNTLVIILMCLFLSVATIGIVLHHKTNKITHEDFNWKEFLEDSKSQEDYNNKVILVKQDMEKDYILEKIKG